MKERTKRTRRTNVAIHTCFTCFADELESYQNETTNVEFYIEMVEKAENRLRNELFGMYLVGAMSWRDYLTLRERVHRTARKTIKKMRNW